MSLMVIKYQFHQGQLQTCLFLFFLWLADWWPGRSYLAGWIDMWDVRILGKNLTHTLSGRSEMWDVRLKNWGIKELRNSGIRCSIKIYFLLLPPETSSTPDTWSDRRTSVHRKSENRILLCWAFLNLYHIFLII